MCRLVAYIGDEISPEDLIVTPSNSLTEQSQDASEAKLSVNGDGFGLAWYNANQDLGVYRDVLPAWGDENLASLCRMIQSKRFLAHVRASTVGESSRSNCHPFTYGNWAFMHNGQIGGFRNIQRRLEQALPDELYLHRRGNTDSEMFFLLLLAHGLESDPEQALVRTLSLIESYQDGVKEPNRYAIVFSDGTNLFAYRGSSDQRSPSLYLSKDFVQRGQVLASEPLDATNKSWMRVAENQFLRLPPNEKAHQVDLATLQRKAA